MNNHFLNVSELSVTHSEDITLGLEDITRRVTNYRNFFVNEFIYFTKITLCNLTL